MTGMCRDAFAAEGASETEIAEELAVIKTQLAFVKQMRGDVDSALSDYRNVLKLKYVAVACLNIAVMKVIGGCFVVLLTADCAIVLWELWLQITL